MIDLGESSSSVDDFEAKLQEKDCTICSTTLEVPNGPSMPIISSRKMVGLKDHCITQVLQDAPRCSEENGAAASGPFCQRLLELLG